MSTRVLEPATRWSRGRLNQRKASFDYDPHTKVRNVHGANQDFAYGAFGRAYFSRDASGAFTHTTYRSCSFPALTCPASAVYEVETVRGGQPTEYVYVDVLEREVRRSVIGFDGTPSHVDREYDALGRLRRESEPYHGFAPVLDYPQLRYPRPCHGHQPSRQFSVQRQLRWLGPH